MKLHILGCSGWIPGKNETSCFMIEHKNRLIILDMGTGISNLCKYKETLSKYDEVSIILSHYHLDHTIGIIYLLPYVKEKKLVIHGPGKPYYTMGTEGYLTELLRTEFFSRPLLKIAKQVECRDYTADGFKIGDIEIGIKEQIHSAPSFQISIDKKLIYATDTAFVPSLFKEDNSGAVLLHECWETSDTGNSKHSSLPMLIEGLSKKNFKKIILIHQNPEWTDEDYENIKNQTEKTVFSLGEDGTKFEI